ncbi:MAG: MarR family winged helix-turn-helix transcriptional regulator [Pseudomonadota bacterium]
MKLLGILDATPINIGYRLAFLTNFYREPLLRKMEREHGIIRPELTVLVCLAYRDGLNARDICEITEQPSNTVSRAVASLMQKGLVSRRDDRSDGRRKLLFLEPLGRQTYDEVMATFEMAETELTACLSQQEREMLLDCLDRMARDVPRWQALPPYVDQADDA